VPGLLCLGDFCLTAAGRGIAAGAVRSNCTGSGLFYLETTSPIFFNKFDGCPLEVSQGLVINDDLDAMTGIYLVAIADLVIQ